MASEGEEPKKCRDAATTYELLNSLADNWLGVLTHTELKIMVKAISHANNRTGDVTLAVETFRRTSGGDRRNVERALANLSDERGILPVIIHGGGRSKSATRRIKLAYSDRSKTPVIDTGVSDDRNPGKSAHETPVDTHTNPGKYAPETPVIDTGGTSINSSKNSSSNNGDAAAGEFTENQRKAIAAMHIRKIQSPTAENLAKSFPRLTARIVQDIVYEMGDPAKPATMVIAIRANAARKISEADARAGGNRD